MKTLNAILHRPSTEREFPSINNWLNDLVHMSRILLGVILLGSSFLSAQGNAADGDDALFDDQEFSNVFLIEMNGPIFGQFHWYLNNQLDQAKQAGADLVIVNLTSPGGDLEYSLQLGRRLREIDWAKTIVYIPEESISGGAIISLGADRIVMKQGALIGDAGPIKLGIEGFEHADEKIVSYLSGAIRELAVGKGRPPAIAEAMVDRSLVVYEVTDKETGETTFISETRLDDPKVAEQYDVGQPIAEAGQNRFLTVAADRAEELGLTELVVDSEEELLANLKIDNVNRRAINWVDKLVYLLNRPWFTALLLIVGLLGLYFELTAPGISVAGLTSILCFGIFFWSHALGGTAGWLEVVLFGLGVLCLIFELFIIPGFGVFGLSGLGLLVVSLVMASQDFVIPDGAPQWNQLQMNLLIVLGSVLGVLVLFFAQIMLLDSIPGFDRFRLAAPEAQAAAVSGAEFASINSELSTQPSRQRVFAVGEQGVATSDLRPSGKVEIDGQLVDVVTEGDYVDSGTSVEVLKVAGNHIVVRRIS